MAEETLKNKTVKGVGWSFADNILCHGIAFFVSLVLARLLTPEDYGLLAYITILISISNSLVNSGFSSALIRKNDVKEEDYNTTFITNLVVSVFLVILLYVTAPTIANFFERTELIQLIRLMSWIIVINALSLVQQTRLRKILDFKTQTKASLISSLISGFVGIGMAFCGCGVWSLVGQQLSRQILYAATLWLLTKWCPHLQFSLVSFRYLFGFGWKLLISGLINTIWNEIYQVVIGKCYSPSTLGQYTRATQFSNMFSSNLSQVVQKVSYPVLSEIQSDKCRLKSGYQRIIKVTMLVSFIVMFGLAVIAKPMVLVLIGEQWLPCVPFLQIICLQMMLYPLHSLNLNMLQVQGRSDLFLKLEIIKKIIAIGPLLLGIYINIYWMLGGSVLIGIISYYLNAFYSGPFLNYSIKEQVKDILPSFLVAVVMAVPIYAMSFILMNPYILLPLQIVVGAIIAITICEVAKLPEYLEIKSIAMPIINKLIKR